MRSIYTVAIMLVALISTPFIPINAQLKPLTEAEVEQLRTFDSVEEAMKSPEEVEAFFLNYANLIEVPAEVENFHNVIALGFGGNSIEKIPEFVFDLKNIQVLGFSHNQITVIPVGISNLKSLTSFRCWNNKITEVPDALLSLPNLQVVELKGNSIPKPEMSRLKKSYPKIKFVF